MLQPLASGVLMPLRVVHLVH